MFSVLKEKFDVQMDPTQRFWTALPSKMFVVPETTYPQLTPIRRMASFCEWNKHVYMAQRSQIHIYFNCFQHYFILNRHTTSCAHEWGQYTPALITIHLIQNYPIKISISQSCATQVGIPQEKINWANSFYSKSSGNPIFGQTIGHQRAENEARNTKMYRG